MDVTLNSELTATIQGHEFPKSLWMLFTLHALVLNHNYFIQVRFTPSAQCDLLPAGSRLLSSPFKSTDTYLIKSHVQQKRPGSGLERSDSMRFWAVYTARGKHVIWVRSGLRCKRGLTAGPRLSQMCGVRSCGDLDVSDSPDRPGRTAAGRPSCRLLSSWRGRPG